jgi:hypothetical protein
VNSEELEQSLRTEFESYLKDVLADMRQEATEFQSRIQAEFDKRKSQFDDEFRSFAARLNSTHEFNDAFGSSVAEHLRLARDEGARITATAMAEAEKLDAETAAAAPAPVASYDLIRDAVNDISSKDSQSSILKALVQNAGSFAPRGAFFIIKNEHFVGWKVFGEDVEAAETAIREIHFRVSEDSSLAAAVQSMNTVQSSAGSHPGDDLILDPLEFGQPVRMYAIPLVARGRTVAVLYADHGASGGDVNREALETLVRVAGLTVELLAASQTAQAENRTTGSADFEDARPEVVEEVTASSEEVEEVYDEVPAVTHEYSDSYDVPVQEFDTDASATENDDRGFAFSGNASYDDEITEAKPNGHVAAVDEVPVETEPSFVSYDSQAFESEAGDLGETEAPAADEVFAYSSVDDTEAPSSSPFEDSVEAYEPAGVGSGVSFNQVAEQVVEAQPAGAAPYARLRDRPVDLPIEVPEDERRIHNDARRFARLLVSEIKLYNEKKVVEGREAQDLYDRLREAIDRSREMYDKRVQPPVAAKFDYFHYEIVNSLANGEAELLGSGYPGSTV